MKQRMKRLSFVVVIAAVAGLFVYGGVKALYRLGDVLSLSPAAKGLLPLAFIFLLWFISSRCLKYFQRRKERRRAQESISARDSEKERRQAWLLIKAKGRKRYVWRYGVMGFGLSSFAIATPAVLIFGPSTHKLSMFEIIAATILSFVVWTAGGYVLGLSMWKTLDNKYREPN